VSPSCYHLPGQDNPTGPRCKDGFSNAGDSESGSFNLATGTWDSVNTFFVQLEQKVGGPSAVAAMGTRLGIAHGLGSGQYGSSLTLGSGGGFSAIDMANAYSTIDAHGIECTPTAITQITDPTGKAVDFTHPACTQVISAQTADTVTSILQGVLTMPGATGAGLGIGRQAAGKTGTVDDGREGWFVGFIPQYVTAIGLFDPLKPGSSAAPICDGVTGRCFTPDNLFGASVSGVAWQDLMERIAGPLPEQDFALPEAGDPAPSPSPSASPSSSTGPTGSTPNPSTSTGAPPQSEITVTVTPTVSPPTAPSRRPTKRK
jgi:membrane peptidoglycan carboxypeptidase